MAILSHCPRCHTEVSLPDRLAGAKVRCEPCGEIYVLPSAAQVPARAERP